MRHIAIALTIVLGGVVLAAPKTPIAAAPKAAAPKPTPVAAPKRFAIGVAPPAHVVRGALSVAGSGLQVSRLSVELRSDGSTTLVLIYTNASSAQVLARQLTIAPSCGQISDSVGNVLAASTPVALCTAIIVFGTQLDTVIGNAASGGKLNL